MSISVDSASLGPVVTQPAEDTRLCPPRLASMETPGPPYHPCPFPHLPQRWHSMLGRGVGHSPRDQVLHYAWVNDEGTANVRESQAPFPWPAVLPAKVCLFVTVAELFSTGRSLQSSPGTYLLENMRENRPVTHKDQHCWPALSKPSHNLVPATKGFTESLGDGLYRSVRLLLRTATQSLKVEPVSASLGRPLSHLDHASQVLTLCLFHAQKLLIVGLN